MKIAIFSDTHDNWHYTKIACQRAREAECEVLIHCGDICAPVTLGYLKEQWGRPLHYCFGNVDGDRFLMLKNFVDDPLIYHHGEVKGEVELGGRVIAFQHYPEIARALATSGRYDAVFYGHDHQKHQEKVAATLLANPGNLCGIKAPPSFGIYQTERGDFSHVDIQEGIEGQS